MSVVEQTIALLRQDICFSPITAASKLADVVRAVVIGALPEGWGTTPAGIEMLCCAYYGTGTDLSRKVVPPDTLQVLGWVNWSGDTLYGRWDGDTLLYSCNGEAMEHDTPEAAIAYYLLTRAS